MSLYYNAVWGLSKFDCWLSTIQKVAWIWQPTKNLSKSEHTREHIRFCSLNGAINLHMPKCPMNTIFVKCSVENIPLKVFISLQKGFQLYLPILT